MLKFDTNVGKLESLSTTNLIEESLLERYDLQEAIVKSWDSFCVELGLGHLYYVASEVIPHSSCRDSIDILALDWEGAPVVIELKRSKNKLQLLQALSYAAMIATWDKEDYVDRVQGKQEKDDIKSLLESVEEMPDPRVVLVAEDYDPEVILTADFLHDRNIDVTAIALQLVKYNNELLMSLSRRYPLPGLEETYTARGVRVRKQLEQQTEGREITWEDFFGITKISWARALVDGLQRRGFGEGNARCRFFCSRRGTSIGDIIGLGFRSDNFLVHVLGQTPENESFLSEKLGMSLEPLGRAGDKRAGWGFRIRTSEELSRFFSALDEK
jgi:hypothetical protein